MGKVTMTILASRVIARLPLSQQRRAICQRTCIETATGGIRLRAQTLIQFVVHGSQVGNVALANTRFSTQYVVGCNDIREEFAHQLL